mmetsp:Transcript_92041/g.269299  ORF Transcript_92041/g.269299 Transcript_92041/m.269299 type:complete len:448 (-) Transcript_92041:41-1384(-)
MLMPCHVPVAVLLSWVPCQASFHDDAFSLNIQAIGGQTSGWMHSWVSDGCLDGSEQLPPLSLLQMHAGSRHTSPAARSSAPAWNWTGGGRTAHGPFRVSADLANASDAASVASQARAARRAHHPPGQQEQESQLQQPSAPPPAAPQTIKMAALEATRAMAARNGEASRQLVSWSRSGEVSRALVLWSVIVVAFAVCVYLMVATNYQILGQDYAMILPLMPHLPVDSPPGSQSMLEKVSEATGHSTEPRGSVNWAEARNSELPMIYPRLVMPVGRTRLAVPVEPLGHPHFRADVYGLSGIPLLSLALVEGPGRSGVQICLHSVNTLVAVVTSGLEILGADYASVGRIARPTEGLCCYVLRGERGRVLLTVSGRHAGDFKMTSVVSDGTVVERATAVRCRPKGRIPVEHYEVVAGPNVDAVLMLSCLLAVLVFGGAGEAAGWGRGRPSS